jgi:hypothetical protein
MPQAVIAEGRYKAIITQWGLGESREKKTPYVGFTFRLLHEIGGDGKPIKCPSFERTLYRYITSETIDFVVRDLKSLGYDRDSFDYLDPKHPQAFSFKGKEIEVTCKHEKYKDEDKERWDFAFSGGLSGPLAFEGVSRLNALFAGKLRPGGGTGTTKPSPNYSAGQRPQVPDEETF